MFNLIYYIKTLFFLVGNRFILLKTTENSIQRRLTSTLAPSILFCCYQLPYFLLICFINCFYILSLFLYENKSDFPLNMCLSHLSQRFFLTRHLRVSLLCFQLHGISFGRSATFYLPSADQVCFQSFANTSKTTINNRYVHFHLFCKNNYFHFCRRFLSRASVPRNYEFKIIEVRFFSFIDHHFAKKTLVFLSIFSLVSI